MEGGQQPASQKNEKGGEQGQENKKKYEKEGDEKRWAKDGK